MFGEIVSMVQILECTKSKLLNEVVYLHVLYFSSVKCCCKSKIVIEHLLGKRGNTKYTAQAKFF